MQAAFLPQWIAPSGALAILVVFAFLLLRDWRFAVLVSLSPLPGYAAAGSLAVFALSRHPPLAMAEAFYLCGYVFAGFAASTITIRIAIGDTKSEAVRGTLRRLLPIALWGVLFCCAASALGLRGDIVHQALGLIAFAALTIASAFLCTLLFPLLFSFSEAFIARANRLREQRERLLDRLAFLVQPRWGLSVSGIALIFAALGFFGGAAPPWPQRWQLAAWAVAIFAISWTACAGIRRGFAMALSTFLIALLAYWASAKHAPDVTAAYLGYEILGLASLPVVLMALQATLFAKEGDNVPVALLRATERTTVSIVFSSLASALAFLCLQGRAALLGTLFVLCGAAIAVSVVPALTTAIYALFPPRVSLEEAFKSR